MDFLTLAGSVLAAMLLREFEPCESQTQAKRNVVAAIKAVSERLGNTPSVCRKCYVHPEVLAKYMDGAIVKQVEAAVEQEVDQQLHVLKAEEHALLRLLEREVVAGAGS